MSPTTSATQQQILDVAVQLFAEKGFAGTTLRNVVNGAKVNLGSVHYHFGSKENLFRAVVASIAEPVVKGQLEALKQLEGTGEALTVEGVLRAFLAPPLQYVNEDQSRIVCAQFMGRCRTEPDPIRAIAAEEFSESQQTFLDQLQRVLPDQTRSQLSWKLDLVIAALIRVQLEAGKPSALLQSSSPEDVERAIQQLVRFLTPGMQMSE